MTSKISFSNMCKEQMKRNLSVVIATIFIYLMELLSFVIGLQNVFVQTDAKGKELQHLLEDTVAPGWGYHLIAIFVGVYLAYSGFYYLHSKVQTDFYGSLPIKRSTYFKMLLRNSLIILCVPLVLTSVIKLLMLGMFGTISKAAVILSLENIFYQFLCAAAAWVLTLVVVSLTGHGFVALLGFGVLSIYAPGMLRYLIPMYSETFFYSYMPTYDGSVGKIFTYFSPFSLAFGLTRAEKPVTYVIGLILWVLIVGALGYMLYIKRPAEAAGRAMAFEKWNALIRILVVIPMALYAGLFLSQMSMRSSKIWLFVGVFVGAVIFHGIMESIYQFDIRGLFSHKKQLLATILLCFGFSLVFLLDLTGYDKWIPSEEEVNSVQVTFDHLALDTDSYWGEKEDGLKKESLQSVFALISKALPEEEVERMERDRQNVISVTVQYEMKNGSVKGRVYKVDESSCEQQIAKIFDDPEFKDDYFSLYTADRSKIKKIEWDNTMAYAVLNLTREEQNTFIDLYLEELSNLTYADIKKYTPCGELTIQTEKVYLPNHGGFRTENEEIYYIYPTFKKTIAYLKNHGCPAKAPLDYPISKLTITKMNEDYEDIGHRAIVDQKVISKYKDDFIYNEMTGFYNRYGYADLYYVTATLKTPKGEQEHDLIMTNEVAEHIWNE